MPSLPPAYVVTGSPERLAQFRAAFAAAGLDALAVREWGACMIPGAGVLGCAVSHYALVRHALASGLDSVLVFEDDAVPSDAAASRLAPELDAARERGDSALRLGWTAKLPRGGDGSHAYALLTPDAMRAYLDAWPKQGTGDLALDNIRAPFASECLFAQHNPGVAPSINLPPGWRLPPEQLRAEAADRLAQYSRAAAAIAERAPHIVYTVSVGGAGAEQFRAQLLASMHAARRHTPTARLHLLFGDLDADTLAAAANLGARLRRIPAADLSRWQAWTKHRPDAAARPWPGIVFARLFLPRLLPDVARCIYLDADTLPVASLAPLHTLDLGGSPVAAAPGIVPEYGFNTGVLVLDLAALRADPDYFAALERLADEEARAYKLPDQTLFNRFFDGRICRLPACWNLPPSIGADPATLAGAKVLHFYNGGTKPTPPPPNDAATAALRLWRAEYATATATPTPKPATPKTDAPVRLLDL